MRKIARSLVGILVFAAALVILQIVVSVPTALAAPANPFPQEVTQSDGSVITIVGLGDEYFNWTETLDGCVIAYDRSTGNWCHAYISADGRILPGSDTVGHASEQAGRIRLRRPDLAGLIENADMTAGQIYIAAIDGQHGAFNTSQSTSLISDIRHTKNSQPLLVMLIEYNNRQFSKSYAADTTAFWSNRVFGTTDNTVYNYYREVSGDFDLKFTKPAFSVADGFSVDDPIADVSSVTIKDGVALVRLNKAHPNTTVLGGTVAADIDLAFSAVRLCLDLSAVPTLSGFILSEDLNIYSILAGFEASAGNYGSGQGIWAHARRWAVRTAQGLYKNFSVDLRPGSTILVGTYGVNGEMSYARNEPMEIGVIVHELGHVLGLPDTYSYISGYGLGMYSSMAQGSWGAAANERHGASPTHMDPWSKYSLGFVVPVEIDYAALGTAGWSGNISSIADGYQVLKVTNAGLDPTQYFLVENRQLHGFDRGLFRTSLPNPGGILVYHIDENVYVAADGHGVNNNNYHKTVDLEGFYGNRGNHTDDPFYVAGGIFNAASAPNSFFHTTGGSHVDNGHYNCHPQIVASGISIGIHSASGHTMLVQLTAESGAGVQSPDITGSISGISFFDTLGPMLGKSATDRYYASEISGIDLLVIEFMDLESLAGIEHFSGLKILRARNNKLTALNVSNNTSLIVLDVYNNHLTGLDVSYNTRLKQLMVEVNSMQSPDDVIGWRQIGLELYGPPNWNGSFRFNPQRLPAPGNTRFEGTIFKWDSVDGASRYEVWINGQLRASTTGAEYNFSALQLPLGTHQFQVRALSTVMPGGVLNSALSDALTLYNVLKGDVDGNGIVNAADAVELLLHIAGLKSLDEWQKTAGKVTSPEGDGLSVRDVTEILMVAAGLKTFFSPVP